MASGKSDYLENKLLDLVLGAVAFTSPSPVYIALSTAAYSDGAMTGEVSGGSYARVSVTNNATNWPAASGGSKSNGVAFTFPAATATWGTVLSAYVMDASTAGNKLYGGDLTTSKTIDTGDTASFAIGTIVVTED